MENRPATAQLMKNTYCLGDNSGCARFQVRNAMVLITLHCVAFLHCFL